MSDDERVKFGVPMSRADVMPYGLLIILRLMKKIGIDNLILCVGNLRSGIAIRYFDKH
jgi:exopolyphosphatase/pppGpp-phosphohydrolase